MRGEADAREASEQKFEVRLATAADRDEIRALIGEMIPGVDVDTRWRWLYDTNPGGRALTWIASEAVAGSSGRKAAVAGCTSFFPFRMWLDGAEIRGALGGDGYVRPAFRRRGLGGLLHDASRSAMLANDIACMYGAPGAMNLTPLKHGGSRDLGLVVRWARPLRGAAIGAKSALLDGAVAFALKPTTRARLEPMLPLDERIDRVWHAAREAIRLGAIRDASFYTWRFLAAPAQKQQAFVIVDGGAPIGACALEPMHGGQTQRIVDLLAIPGAWRRCLRAIARHAVATTPARTLDIKLFSLDGRRRHMWRAGFTEREQKPFLCMIPAGGDRRFLDPQRWFYSGADSDLDDHD